VIRVRLGTWVAPLLQRLLPPAPAMGLQLELVKNSDPRLRGDMADHYSKPGGFVGRNLCYAVTFDGRYYGGIVGGSSPRHLPGRLEFFDVDPAGWKTWLQSIVNNLFFHVEPGAAGYPLRNFTTRCVGAWRERVAADWAAKYLVELPRSGELYKRDGWTCVGQTIGMTCKRTSGKGTDSWSGKRVWDTVNLRPKLVFARKL
jgi:hypothetical protein